jgi:hypothetical protein
LNRLCNSAWELYSELKLTDNCSVESKSAEASPAESNPWTLAKLEIPKQLRFWEANEQRKRDEASAPKSNVEVAKEREYSDFEEELLFKEHTVDAQTSRGLLSPAAINTIEQFSRFVAETFIKSSVLQCAPMFRHMFA